MRRRSRPLNRVDLRVQRVGLLLEFFKLRVLLFFARALCRYGVCVLKCLALRLYFFLFALGHYLDIFKRLLLVAFVAVAQPRLFVGQLVIVGLRRRHLLHLVRRLAQ